MADELPEPDSGPRVFISYRRDDAAAHAGRLYDALIDRFGTDRVFIDVDSIQVGADFTHAVEEAIQRCDAVVVVMGPSWATATDSKGHRRLDNPDDLVRLELEFALEGSAGIFPVLVQGADMPASDELPSSLSRLVRRHAFDIADRRWRSDIHELISALEGLARQNQTAIDEQARLEAAELQAQEQAQRGAEEQAQRKAEEQVRLRAAEFEVRLKAAEEQVRTARQEQARLDAAELQVRAEAEEKARLVAEEQGRLKSAEFEAGLKAAELQVRLEREAQARRDAEELARLPVVEEQSRQEAEELPAAIPSLISTRGQRIVLFAGSFLALDLLFVPWQRIEGYGNATGIEKPNSLPGVLAFLITLVMVGGIIATKAAAWRSDDPAVIGPGTSERAGASHFWGRWRHLIAAVAVFALLLVKFVVDVANLNETASGSQKLGGEALRLIVAIEDTVGAPNSLEPGAYLGLLLAAALVAGGFSLRKASAGRRPPPTP